MENILFIANSTTDYCKTNKGAHMKTKSTTTTPATTTATTMLQINKFKNKNIKFNHTTYLSYKNRWRTPDQSLRRNKFNKFIPASNAITQINVSFISIINRVGQPLSCGFIRQHLWLTLWLLVTLMQHVESFEMTTSAYKTKETEATPSQLYSQLLSTNGQLSIHDSANNINSEDTFRPFVPTDPELITNNVFMPSGQFRAFQPIDTDLRVSKSVHSKSQHYGRNKMSEQLNVTLYPAHETQQITRKHENSMERAKRHEAMVPPTDSSNLSHTKYERSQQQKQENHSKAGGTQEHQHQHQHQQKQKQSIDNDAERNKTSKQNDLTSDLKDLEGLLNEYVTNFFEKGHYKPMPGLLVELEKNYSQNLPNELGNQIRSVRQTAATDAKISIDLPRTLATGRLLFLTGLKKVLWPVFMGLQVLKSLLIAMFIPAIIGSFTKLLGKGISTGSAPLFIRPIDPPQELDFRDNSLNFEDDNKFLITDGGIKDNSPYVYNQPDASPQMHNEYVFDPSATNNQLAYTRLGMNERQHQLMQDSYMSALQSIGSASFKNSGSLSSSSSGLLAPMAKRPPPAANINNFQKFQNVPDSSLLLSNYDPFYSPLLSRLDSVFAQLKLNSDKEMCREKLICLMYANPAKYAPYSNLVSAQLSRELNELRKPTSDNPDILRFFKYMRAAKDGQDGVDCEKTFDKCTEFKDFENPAMVSTYHDINKLVQARKLKNK